MISYGDNATEKVSDPNKLLRPFRNPKFEAFQRAGSQDKRIGDSFRKAFHEALANEQRLDPSGSARQKAVISPLLAQEPALVQQHENVPQHGATDNRFTNTSSGESTQPGNTNGTSKPRSNILKGLAFSAPGKKMQTTGLSAREKRMLDKQWEQIVSSTAASANSVNTQDVSLTKIDRSAYAALPNKLALGQPSQYYVERVTTPKIYLYQAPDLNTYTTLKYYVIKRIEDAGAYTNDADVAYRFLPCMCAGLSYYLAMKKAPQLVQQNKLIYEDELKRALDEDGQRTSTYITPQSFYPNGV